LPCLFLLFFGSVPHGHSSYGTFLFGLLFSMSSSGVHQRFLCSLVSGSFFFFFASVDSRLFPCFFFGRPVGVFLPFRFSFESFRQHWSPSLIPVSFLSFSCPRAFFLKQACRPPWPAPGFLYWLGSVGASFPPLSLTGLWPHIFYFFWRFFPLRLSPYVYYPGFFFIFRV